MPKFGSISGSKGTGLSTVNLLSGLLQVQYTLANPNRDVQIFKNLFRLVNLFGLVK